MSGLVKRHLPSGSTESRPTKAKPSGHKGPSHIAPHKRSRPFVAATFAMTVDGKITTRTFSPVDFTSREDKLHLLRQRALGDAVLIGRSTLAHDNVRLGLPDPAMRAEREARGQAPWPIRVIVSNEGRIDPALKIFQTDFSRVVIFSTTRMPRKYQVALREKATRSRRGAFRSRSCAHSITCWSIRLVAACWARSTRCFQRSVSNDGSPPRFRHFTSCSSF